ncbi:MAG: hypothetical protein CMO80_24330 [Verrucomicrobiales bacterium]|nr:hypothetical protein [Verrucomicrobiales bacterium]|tara:strand:+ start:3319 stop:4260 length:942 start_codon:yes stop_codon:yes gene_type:complete
MENRVSSGDEDEVGELKAQVGRLTRKIGRLQAGLDELEGIAEDRTRELYDVNNKLARFIPPQISQMLEQNGTQVLEAERRYLTVVFGDLQGFTDVAEVMESEQVTSMINDYFDVVLEEVAGASGLLDKFIGDGFMAFWGAPETAGRQEDAKSAARFALSLQKHFGELVVGWRKQGLDHEVNLRLGMHSGYCSVGNFGSSQRLQYTAMGNPVNLAARLESAAETGTVLTSRVTATMISGWIPVQEAGKIRVKGIKHAVSTFTLKPEQRQESALADDDQVTQFLGRLEETQQLDPGIIAKLHELARKELPNHGQG